MPNLILIATACRSAFDDFDLSNAPGFLPQFPKGCCGWACRFIGYYLKVEYNLEPFHICASRAVHSGPDTGHEWIQFNKTVIDITADQFPDQTQHVIVSENSTWHKSWQINTKEEASLFPMSKYDHGLQRDDQIISKIYNQFVNNISKNHT